MKPGILSLIIIGAGLFFSSCEYSPYVEPKVVAPTEPISFSRQIQPIFDAKCNKNCHNPGVLELSNGKAYQSLMSKSGMVDTLNPAASIIVTYPASKGTHMGSYSAQEDLLVLTWIEEGAKNN